MRAEPPARLEITPRPPGAPPPAWAPPRRGCGGGGRAGRGSLLRSAGPSRELEGAAPTRALRLPRPHGPRASKEPLLGAVQWPRGWGRSCWGPRPYPRFPESRTGGCHLAPERGQSAATALVGRTPAPTWENDKASPERAVTAAGQGRTLRTRRCRGAGLVKRRGLIPWYLLGESLGLSLSGIWSRSWAASVLSVFTFSKFLGLWILLKGPVTQAFPRGLSLEVLVGSHPEISWGRGVVRGQPGSAGCSLYMPSTHTEEVTGPQPHRVPGQSRDEKGRAGALTPVLFFRRTGSPHLQGASRFWEGRQAGFSQELDETVNHLLIFRGPQYFEKPGEKL